MNIEEINRKHFIETDMYYRVGYGLSSKLINFSNGIFSIEVVIGGKWSKDYNTTAQEIAYLWKNSHSELGKSIGCKIYIVDSRSYPYKQALLHRSIHPGFDAKKGILFRKGYLN
jgi:hypothetical protein